MMEVNNDDLTNQLLAPLTDISSLVEAIHQPQFSCYRLSEWQVDCTASQATFFRRVPRGGQIIGGQNSPAKYSIEFDDFAESNGAREDQRRPYLRLSDRPYT